MVWNTCWPTGNVGTPLSHCTLANTVFFLKILSILIGEGRVLLVLKSAFLRLRISPTLTSRAENMGRWGKTQREQFEERPGVASLQAVLWECLECLKGTRGGHDSGDFHLEEGWPSDTWFCLPRGCPGFKKPSWPHLLCFPTGQASPPPNFHSERGNLLTISMKSEMRCGRI